MHCANVGGPQYADIGLYGLEAFPVRLAPGRSSRAMPARAAAARVGAGIVFRKGPSRLDAAGRHR